MSTVTATAAQTLSLKIGREAAPPDSLVQLKVFVTEPRPISTGFTSMTLDGFDAVAGIAIGSSAPDALGVAMLRRSSVTFSILSPSMAFGMTPDYPVLTVVAHVAADAVLGNRLPVTLTDMQFLDASGNVYSAAVTPGSVLVTPYVGIEDVHPGSGVVGPGDVVTLVGRGFQTGATVRVKESLVSDVTVVDPSRLNVVFSQVTALQGAGITVVNPDKTRTTYFSYQRTSRQTPTLNPVLQIAVPVFPDADVTSAIVPVSGVSTGLALQNRQGSTATVWCDLLDANGATKASQTVTVDPRRFVLRDLSEVFGAAYSTTDSVRVRSALAIQVMGVAVDAAGGATPIATR